jgi:hypothetical protein
MRVKKETISRGKNEKRGSISVASYGIVNFEEEQDSNVFQLLIPVVIFC